MSSDPALIWFRRDLRLSDNPALQAALTRHSSIIPVYIHAPEEEALCPLGSASRWWLYQSLKQLGKSLAERGSRLILRQGSPTETLLQLCQESKAKAVYWNQLPEPAAQRLDSAIAKALRSSGITVSIYPDTLLFNPALILNRDGLPFRRFTPFWRACLIHGLPQDLEPPPKRLPTLPKSLVSLALEALGLLPKIPWYTSLASCWQPGEASALAVLQQHVCQIQFLQDYPKLRERPDLPGTSKLSPFLHFGEISPKRVVASVLASVPETIGYQYLRQLGWREFSHYLLYHFPQLPQAPLDERFARFPWRQEYADLLAAWQRGETGIPLVDAGMRQLWQTGWMHNRVRMVVGSFLVKHLLIPWQEGARWFLDTLVDADLANNSQNWQWVAGCGVDAVPYFRIFNPVLQGRKFDPEGNYVRRWVPELAKLPSSAIHAPWEASRKDLHQGKVELGGNYPRPIVDLKFSRSQALAAFKRWRMGVSDLSR